MISKVSQDRQGTTIKIFSILIEGLSDYQLNQLHLAVCQETENRKIKKQNAPNPDQYDLFINEPR